MKVLLAAVNAKFIHSNLAIRDLEAYARAHLNSRYFRGPEEGRKEIENRLELETIEYTINQQEEDILADIYKRKPDLVAFSCYIWNIRYIEELVRDLKLVLPELAIWLGGPEVSFTPDRILEEFPEVTGILCGEGEISFARLLAAYADAAAGLDFLFQEKDSRISGLLLDRCTGIVFRNPNTGQIQRTLPSEPVDMDQIPFFYADLPEFASIRDQEGVGEEYRVTPQEEETKTNPTAAKRTPKGGIFDHKIIYYESSRGCPFRCSYCLSALDKQVRFRSLDLVQKELQFFLDAGVPQVKFVDRTFNCRHEHTMGILHYIKEHDNGITNFHFEVAADLLTDEEIRFLADLRPGQVQLEIGVQSTNLDTIRDIDRVQDLHHLESVVDRIHQGANIHQHLDLIVGLPEENMASFIRSFNDVYRMKPQQLQLGFLKVLKGSVMERKAEEYGLTWHREAPYEVLSSKWISYAEVLELKAVEEMVEVYYNSLQFTRTIAYLTDLTEDPFGFFKALADYYVEKGLAGFNQSRMDRFRILRDFVAEKYPKQTRFVEDLLIYDLYLRENAKSRPEWAGDPQETKELFRDHFRQILGSRMDRRMIHGERFYSDVADLGGPGPWDLVFDYRRRDPLTDNAFVYKLGENVHKDGK